MRNLSALRFVRAGVGVVDLVFPNTVVRWLGGGQPSDQGRRVIRVLGARQIAQALLSGRTSTEAALLLGAAVDVAHAATMILMGAFERRYRLAALCDAVIAISFAAAGVAAAARGAVSEPTGTSRMDAWRNEWAERLAHFIVPRYLQPPTG